MCQIFGRNTVSRDGPDTSTLDLIPIQQAQEWIEKPGIQTRGIKKWYTTISPFNSTLSQVYSIVYVNPLNLIYNVKQCL